MLTVSTFQSLEGQALKDNYQIEHDAFKVLLSFHFVIFLTGIDLPIVGRFILLKAYLIKEKYEYWRIGQIIWSKCKAY